MQSMSQPDWAARGAAGPPEGAAEGAAASCASMDSRTCAQVDARRCEVGDQHPTFAGEPGQGNRPE